MLGKLIKYEANKNENYFRVIQTEKEYSDKRKFPIDEVVSSINKINFEAQNSSEIGGFFVSTYEYIFRWLIRGDTLCKVIIPENSKIYKTTSENGIYVTEKMILTNPIKINDSLAMELYSHSKLPEISYFKAMTACAIMGYIDTALKVCNDKVNKENVKVAISELNDFCQRRNDENYINNPKSIETVNILYEKLNSIKEQK